MTFIGGNGILLNLELNYYAGINVWTQREYGQRCDF